MTVPDMRVLVLGVGNLLWADEGFGVRAIERLAQNYSFPASVSLMDGGTQGLYLLQYVQSASHVLLFDAVDYALEPGSLKIVRDDEVPQFMGAKKMSLHQVGFQETLMAAQLTQQYPRHITLIGVQPQELEDYGGGLTEVVAAQLDPAIELGLQELQEWGIEVTSADTASIPLSPLSMVG